VAQVTIEVLRKPLRLHELIAGGAIPDQRLYVMQLQMQRGQLLADVIMQVASNAPTLFFLHSYEPLKDAGEPLLGASAHLDFHGEFLGSGFNALLEFDLRLSKRVLEAFALRQVARHLYKPGQDAIVSNPSQYAACVEANTAFGDVPALVCSSSCLTRRSHLVLVCPVFPILGRKDDACVSTEDFGFGVTKHSLRACIPRVDMPFYIERENGLVLNTVDN
jgi:hypothetical protein